MALPPFQRFVIRRLARSGDMIARALLLLDERVAVLEGNPIGASGTYDCETTVEVGDVVYFTSSGRVDRALALTSQPDAIGIAISKPNPGVAEVLSSGSAKVFSGLIPGQTYFLSDTEPGKMTLTPPTVYGTKVQVVGVAASDTELYIDVDGTVVAN